MRGHWFMSLGQQEHACLGNALFHSNNLVHLRHCQHSQGPQVGSICRMQLRRSDIVVSPDILKLF